MFLKERNAEIDRLRGVLRDCVVFTGALLDPDDAESEENARQIVRACLKNARAALGTVQATDDDGPGSLFTEIGQ